MPRSQHSTLSQFQPAPNPLCCSRARHVCRLRIDGDGGELRLPSLHQFKQQLFGQGFGLHRADLFALATQAIGNGEDLPRHPVGALVRLAIDLDSEQVAGWRVNGDVHGAIMDDFSI